VAALASPSPDPVTPSLPPAFVPWFEARCPDIPVPGALAVFELAAAGASVPFIARYRREATSNLDEAAVRRCLEAREQWDRVVARQDIILESIVRHSTLAPELRERIRATHDPAALEDLYLPFRQRKKSRRDAAREAGLEPLADWIWGCGHGTEAPQEGQTLELWAFTFRNEEKSIPDAKSAIEGARDILVERLADDADLRAAARLVYLEEGWLRSTRTDKAKAGGRYESYFDFQEKVSALLGPAAAARYLTLRRGLSEGELLLSVGGGPGDEGFDERVLALFEKAALTAPGSPGDEVLKQAAKIAYKGLVRSALENDVHRALKDAADAAESAAFAESVRRTLLEAPFGPRPVLGVHPTREGVGASVVDAAGRLVEGRGVPASGADGEAAKLDAVVSLAREHAVAAVAIPRSSLGREVELELRPLMRAAGLEIPLIPVNDAGAGSVAASEGARAETPDLDPAARAAVSIARRLQDPLAELVKVDARHLGGGQYPHDVAPPVLHRALDAALESCVHAVGVNLATASRPLLARVSGLGPGLAAAVVEWRSASGAPRSRAQLLEVPGLPPAAYEQAAGFLRLPGSEHPLDATGVHPERYAVLEETAARHGRSVADLLGPGASLVRDDEKAREALGPWTHEAVVAELEQPGRDPRPDFVPFAFREDLRTIEDLRPGMVCPGIVNHVTSFGAFVDVGVRADGLVHISQLGRGGTGDARELIHPGERVEARVVKIDLAKKQISLSLRPPAPKRPTARARPRRSEAPRGKTEGAAAEASGPGAAASRPPGPRSRPSGPRPGGSRPPGRRPQEKRPAERRPAFNNPFAVLADLKVSRRKS